MRQGIVNKDCEVTSFTSDDHSLSGINGNWQIIDIPVSFYSHSYILKANNPNITEETDNRIYCTM